MALNIGRLFRKPKSWTSQHLEGLNVREQHHQPASAVVENAHLPGDDEPCVSKSLSCSTSHALLILPSQVFASLVEDFAGPTKDDIINYFVLDEDNIFSMCLGFLSSAVTSFKHGHSPLSEVLHLTSNLHVCTDHHQQLYAWAFTPNICTLKLRTNRRKACCSSIPFQLSSPRVKGNINKVGSYHSRTDRYRHLPLTIIIVCHFVERGIWTLANSNRPERVQCLCELLWR